MFAVTNSPYAFRPAASLFASVVLAAVVALAPSGCGSPDELDPEEFPAVSGSDSGGSAAEMGNWPDGCSEDPVALMRKPFEQGGCQDPVNGGCHESGDDGEHPDLESPGVLGRLLNVNAECDEQPGLVLIAEGEGLEGSFMANMLSPEDFLCGEEPMPAFPADPNSPEARATRVCLESWITLVSGGG